MILVVNKARMRGFSLVELMVAMAVGLVVLSVVVALFGSMTRSNAAVTNASQEVQNGGYAMRFLADDLRHAGYYGGAYNLVSAALGVLPDPCETTDVVALRAGLALAVQGYHAAPAAPITCIPASDFVAGTDVLVVRRASTVATAPANLDAHEIYIQNNNDWTDTNSPALNVGLASNFPLLNKDGATPADILKYYVRVYYVSPCHLYAPGTSVCTPGADGGRPVPTLKMLELGLGAAGNAVAMNSIALAEGVESLQLEYGIDASGQGPAQNFLTTPASIAEWSNVTEIRLNLLVRNPQATPGYIDVKTYNLGLAGPVTPGGPFKRHLFSEQVRLTNVGETREAP